MFIKQFTIFIITLIYSYKIIPFKLRQTFYRVLHNIVLDGVQMRKIFVVSLLILVLVVFGCARGTDSAGDVVAAPDNGIVEIRTVLENYQYNPDTITVSKGSKVRLTIENRDNVVHGLNLHQFGIVGSQPPNAVKTVVFTAIETPTNGQPIPTCSEAHGETLTINVV